MCYLQVLPLDSLFNFVGGSPVVRNNDVLLNISFRRAVAEARCALVIGIQVLVEADCKTNIDTITHWIICGLLA